MGLSCSILSGGFHDGGKANLKDKYFDGPDAYDAAANTTSLLTPFPEVEEKDASMEEQADSNGDQVFLDNYICKFVDNPLYKVGCKLTEEITD